MTLSVLKPYSYQNSKDEEGPIEIEQWLQIVHGLGFTRKWKSSFKNDKEK